MKEKLARETTLEIIRVILEEQNGYSRQQIVQEELAEDCEHSELWDRIYLTVFKALGEIRP
jgi:hypothetical protein